MLFKMDIINFDKYYKQKMFIKLYSDLLFQLRDNFVCFKVNFDYMSE